MHRRFRAVIDRHLADDVIRPLEPSIRHIADDAAARATLKLGPDSRVLVFGTEGATDPVLWERLVGRPPSAVEGNRT